VLLADDLSDPEQVVNDHAKAHGVQKHHVYRHALRGYSATLQAGAVDALRKRREVVSVTEDQVVRAYVDQPRQVVRSSVLRLGGD
jgi:hypothetical protein